MYLCNWLHSRWGICFWFTCVPGYTVDEVFISDYLCTCITGYTVDEVFVSGYLCTWLHCWRGIYFWLPEFVTMLQYYDVCHCYNSTGKCHICRDKLSEWIDSGVGMLLLNLPGGSTLQWARGEVCCTRPDSICCSKFSELEIENSFANTCIVSYNPTF